MAKETPKKAAFKELVQISLLPEHVSNFQVWLVDDRLFYPLWQEYLNAGISFTVSRNEKNNNYSCAVFDTNLLSINAGLMFYKNADTPFGALALAVWCLGELVKGESWKGFGSGETAQFS